METSSKNNALVLVLPDVVAGNNALAERGRAIVRHLQHDWRLTVITNSYAEEPDSLWVAPINVEVRQVRAGLPKNTDNLGRRVVGELWFGLLVVLQIVRRRRAPVFITSPPFIVSIQVMFFCFLLRKKVALDVRDLYPEIYARSGLLTSDSFIYRVIEKIVGRFYKAASCLISVSDGLADHISRNYDASDILIIRNGYNSETFSGSTCLNRKKEELIAISHGNFGELFDLDLFTNMARSLPSRVVHKYKIILVGFGKKLEEIKRRALPHVHVVGPVSSSEIVKLLCDADVGLSFHAKYDENLNGFPVKVFEFIGVGLPCIVTPLHEGGRMVNREMFGFAFSEGSAEQVTEKIALLLNDGVVRTSIQETVLKSRLKYSIDSQMAPLSDELHVALGFSSEV